MNMTRAISIARSALLILLIVLVVFATVFGYKPLGIDGIFEEDTIRLGLDLAGGSIITYKAIPEEGESVNDSGMDSVVEVMRYRLDSMGYTEALVYRFGDAGDMLRIEIPSIDDPDEAAKVLGSTAKLEFRDYQGNVLVEGKHIKEAYPSIDNSTGDVMVTLMFTGEGEKVFETATATVSGYGSGNNTLAIYLDEELLSNPKCEGKITGDSAVITGDFTREYAQELANLINGGALEYDLVVDSQSSVGPTLGERSLETSLKAGALGILLVMLFMIIIYRIPGVIASINLVAYTAIVGLVLVFTKANLTLPGIAGIVLSIGMAVDANVVIFERMKEEIRGGKSVKAAIDAGFDKALAAVVDSNVTTIIAAVVLWVLGSGSIQGFAITLFIGVVVSLFTALVLTRAFLKLSANILKVSPKLYGVSAKKGGNN